MQRNQNRTKTVIGGPRRMPSKQRPASSPKPTRKVAPVSKALRSYSVRDPQIATGGNSIAVSHREFITDVTGQTLFTPLSFPINAGYDIMFPWLSDLAMRYERYQFSRLRFVYEPRCSTATAGTVILAIDYDPLDAAPVNKQDVYSYHHAAQSSPWDECCCVVDSSILANRGTLFNRNGAIPTGSDLKTYDLGNLWLCVSGFSSSIVCGELFVEYTVSLKIPQTSSNTQSGTITGTAGVSAAGIFGTLVPSGRLDMTVSSPTTLTFNQNWTGQVSLSLAGTVFVAGGYVNTGSATVTPYSSGEIVDAAQTHLQCLFSVTALRGQTWVPSVTATTIASTTLRFGQTV